MTTYTVIKPFKSLNRRFAIGETLDASDIDGGGTLTAEQWQERGFLEEVLDAPLIEPPAPVAPVFDPDAPLN